MLYSFRAPHPAYALRYNTRDAEKLAAIEARYPTAGHYDPWARTVFLPTGTDHWDFLVIARQDLAAFPEPTGPVKGEAAEFVVVAAP